jgi:hypothetical protein
VLTQALEWLTTERKLTESYGVHSKPTEPNDTAKPDTRHNADTTDESEGQSLLFSNMHLLKKQIPAECEEALRKAVKSTEGMDMGKAREE